ncbi:MAG: FAD binding domain-containing protein [Chloroflexota bacterium]|nr:FAD binding domain-containing protein [Chloroflexota bacterium]
MTALAPLSIHQVTSVAQASEVLAELGDEAVVYAGGTELFLVMKLGFAAYRHLVDVKPIPELNRLEVVDGALRIGGAVTHRAIERSPLVAAGWPGLPKMERVVANLRVRNVGSLGGNLAFADPHSDPATFLLAADARVELGLGDERRSLPIDEFVLGPYTTALRPHEIVVAVEVPAVPSDAAMAHLRFAFHERPAATISCLIRVVDGHVAEARVAVGSVGINPVRVPVGEALLVGADAASIDPSSLDAVGRAAADAAHPVADANGSPDYKADLVRVLVGRCVRTAVQPLLAQA